MSQNIDNEVEIEELFSQDYLDFLDSLDISRYETVLPVCNNSGNLTDKAQDVVGPEILPF